MTQKLDILEFLCDEIFGMELFSAEMHRRFIVNSVANAPYASLPSPNELKSIVNVDDCAVCGLDGELIYCDNHPGEWLCPKCTIVDPARMGSLYGGNKCSLDWFSVEELASAKNEREAAAYNIQAMQAANIQQGYVNPMSMNSIMPMTPMMAVQM